MTQETTPPPIDRNTLALHILAFIERTDSYALEMGQLQNRPTISANPLAPFMREACKTEFLQGQRIINQTIEQIGGLQATVSTPRGSVVATLCGWLGRDPEDQSRHRWRALPPFREVVLGPEAIDEMRADILKAQK